MVRPLQIDLQGKPVGGSPGCQGIDPTTTSKARDVDRLRFTQISSSPAKFLTVHNRIASKLCSQLKFCSEKIFFYLKWPKGTFERCLKLGNMRVGNHWTALCFLRLAQASAQALWKTNAHWPCSYINTPTTVHFFEIRFRTNAGRIPRETKSTI